MAYQSRWMTLKSIMAEHVVMTLLPQQATNNTTIAAEPRLATCALLLVIARSLHG